MTTINDLEGGPEEIDRKKIKLKNFKNKLVSDIFSTPRSLMVDLFLRDAVNFVLNPGKGTNTCCIITNTSPVRQLAQFYERPG